MPLAPEKMGLIVEGNYPNDPGSCNVFSEIRLQKTSCRFGARHIKSVSVLDQRASVHVDQL